MLRRQLRSAWLWQQQHRAAAVEALLYACAPQRRSLHAPPPLATTPMLSISRAAMEQARTRHCHTGVDQHGAKEQGVAYLLWQHRWWRPQLKRRRVVHIHHARAALAAAVLAAAATRLVRGGREWPVRRHRGCVGRMHARRERSLCPRHLRQPLYLHAAP